MIRFRRLRLLRLALVGLLLLGGPAGSAPVIAESAICGMVGNSISCGDPEVEAQLKAQALTPEQARTIGCPPLEWDDDDTPSQPETISTGEAGPSHSPRTPDQAIAARVNQAWDRIERWLGAHASVTLRTLKFGADPQDLARWEDTHGRKLPDDLYASYLRHNGADGSLGAGFQLPPSHGLLEVYDIDYINWGNCHALVMSGDLKAADPEHGRWHGSLMAIGSDGYGRELFVEPRTGRVGEAAFDEELRYDGPMGWPSYLHLLEALATALESGTALRDWYPAVTSRCELRWATAPTTLPAGCAGGPRPTPTPTVEPTPQPPTLAEMRATGCRPARRTPRIRPVDPQITAQVGAVWRRIERWLARRAPLTHKQLRPPASARDIAKAEAAMGLRFPDDLRASLLRHDGGGSWGFGPAPFYELMSARAAHADWKMLCGLVLDGAAGELDTSWWDGHLIPFADAHDGGNLFIDTRTGRTGEYFNETGLRLEGDVVWPSYLALLKATVNAMESGKPIRGWRPAVTKGRFEWKSTR